MSIVGLRRIGMLSLLDPSIDLTSGDRQRLLLISWQPEADAEFLATMQSGGFDVSCHLSPSDALRLAAEVRADCTVVRLAPEYDGLALIRKLREDLFVSVVPVIVVALLDCMPDHKVLGDADIDGYVVDPFDTEELLARIGGKLRRIRELRDLSPDTSLPGNNQIVSELRRRIESDDAWAACLIDIDRFKSVSDSYGFARAGEFIFSMGAALRVAADVAGYPRPFLGHIGGDDFLAICQPEQMRKLTEHMVIHFERSVDVLYDPRDAQRGYVERLGGRGTVVRAHLVTVSIGVAMVAAGARPDVREVIAVAAHMKEIAKSQPGSYVAVDNLSLGESGID